MIELIFEDQHLFVLNKPTGLLTQPSGTQQENLEDQAKAWIKEHHQKPGNVFLHAVHRLDKSVSGVVLFAKTSKALARLNQSIRSKLTKKIYIALVEGALPKSEGILEHYLIHDDFKATVATQQHPEAKLARLKYRVLGHKDNLSQIEIELETGRYHQIRAQFAALGCPIAGDRKYGSRVPPYSEGAIALHHHQLMIPHPISQSLMEFLAPLPHKWPAMT